jgi:hypothetical protein
VDTQGGSEKDLFEALQDTGLRLIGNGLLQEDRQVVESEGARLQLRRQAGCAQDGRRHLDPAGSQSFGEEGQRFRLEDHGHAPLAHPAHGVADASRVQALGQIVEDLQLVPSLVHAGTQVGRHLGHARQLAEDRLEVLEGPEVADREPRGQGELQDDLGRVGGPV